MQSTGGDTQALFAEINRGGDVTKGLRRVTDDMKTHKNPELRSAGTAPTPSSKGAPPVPARPGQRKPAVQSPVLELRGNKWFVVSSLPVTSLKIPLKPKPALSQGWIELSLDTLCLIR